MVASPASRTARRNLAALSATHVLGSTGLGLVLTVATITAGDRSGSDMVAPLGQTIVFATSPHDDAARFVAGLFVLGLGWPTAMVVGSTVVATSTPPGARIAEQGLTDLSIMVAGALGQHRRRHRRRIGRIRGARAGRDRADRGRRRMARDGDRQIQRGVGGVGYRASDHR